MGLLPRCVEWVTGIQKDRERIQTDRQTVVPLLHLQEKSEAGRIADALCGMLQLRVCSLKEMLVAIHGEYIFIYTVNV